MYTVKKIETPDRGPLFAVCNGDSDKEIVSRYTDEEEAKEACTNLNGGEKAEKKLAAAEKKAEEDAKKVAEADAKSRAAAKPKAETPKAEDNHKPRAHAARAKAHVRRMAPKPTRRHK
jgi:membrane protein involved in colicin uptake